MFGFAHNSLKYFFTLNLYTPHSSNYLHVRNTRFLINLVFPSLITLFFCLGEKTLIVDDKGLIGMSFGLIYTKKPDSLLSYKNTTPIIIREDFSFFKLD